MTEPEMDFDIVLRLPMPLWILHWENPPDLASFRILSANSSAASILSVPLSDVVGQRMADAFPRIMQTAMPALYAEVITGGITRSLRQVPFGDKNVPDAVFDIHAFPLDGNTLGVVMEVATEQWKMEVRARRAETLLERVQETAQVGSFYWDAKNNAMTWSSEMYRIYGRAPGEFEGTLEAFLSCVHKDDRADVRRSVEATIQAGGSFRITERILRPGGEIRTLELVGVADQDVTGRFIGLHGTCIDISERTLAKSRLALSEERFRLLVEKVTDYAIFMLDVDGKVMSWNEGAARIKGYRADEIIGEPISRFYPPEEVRRRHPESLLKKAETEGRVEEEGWRVRKDGTRFWADVLITALRDDTGQLRGYGKVTRDLTERREAELALSELSGRLMQTQDDERRRLARELHDSTSPLLTRLTAKLYTMRQMAAQRGEDILSSLVEDALTNAEATAMVLRTMSGLLHPPLLDESGLLASLRWYLDTYARRTEIKIETKFPVSMARLPKEAETALFRVAQEAVSNILRHAGSRRIKVMIEIDQQHLKMHFNGDGHELSPAMQQELRLGRGDAGIALAGMRERMRQLGGALDFWVEMGLPYIKATLPLKRG